MKRKPLPTEFLGDSSHHGGNNFKFASNILNESTLPSLVDHEEKAEKAKEAANPNSLDHSSILSWINPFHWFHSI